MKPISTCGILKQILVAFILCPTAYSQDVKKNHVFGELGGPAYLYSLNYERALVSNISIRLGLSYFQLKLGDLGPDKYFSAPLMINQIFGSGHHKLETGLGETFQIIRRLGRDVNRLSPTAALGYRYVSEDHLVLRIAFMPVYLHEKKRIVPMGALSVGGIF